MLTHGLLLWLMRFFSSPTIRGSAKELRLRLREWEKSLCPPFVEIRRRRTPRFLRQGVPVEKDTTPLVSPLRACKGGGEATRSLSFDFSTPSARANDFDGILPSLEVAGALRCLLV